MNFGIADVFYRVGRWPGRDGGTSFALAHCSFPVRGRGLELVIGGVINNVRRMRMHRYFLSRWYMNVKHPNLIIVENYFVGLRPSGNFQHVLGENR